MKKLIILIVFLIVGCTAKTKIPIPNENLIPDIAEEAFDRANNGSYEKVALLATQLVSGTNYMFLVKNNEEWKIVVVYNTFDNKSEIKSVKPFNIDKYKTNNTINIDNIVGSWKVEESIRPGKLNDEKLQNNFEKATKNYKLLPITSLIEEKNTNYILCINIEKEKRKLSIVGIKNDKLLSISDVNVENYTD